MLNCKKLAQKKLAKDKGFTILEVLVAILIASGFLAVSLQAMVVATVFRVRAQEKQIGSQLIQEEIENLNKIAIDLPETLSKCSVANFSNGYAQALWNSYTTSTSYDSTPNRYLLGGTDGKRIGLRRISADLPSPFNAPASYSLSASVSPHRALRIRYEIREWDGTNFEGDTDNPNAPEIIAQEYIEVIPNAALQCP